MREKKKKIRKNKKRKKKISDPTYLFLCRFFLKKKTANLGVFHLGEKKRKKKKILRSFSLKIDRMILFCRSSFPSSEGGRSYAVFFIFLRRVSETREGIRVGGEDRPDSRLQFG